MGVGTLCFMIEDDEGITHNICITNSLHVDQLPMTLISPQHWNQSVSYKVEVHQGDNLTITWKNHKKTVHYSASTNTPMFRSASGTSKYQAFAAILSEIEGEDQHQQSISCGWTSEGETFNPIKTLSYQSQTQI